MTDNTVVTSEERSDVGPTRAAVLCSVVRAFDSLELSRSYWSATNLVPVICESLNTKASEANRQLSRLWTAATLPEGWDGIDAEAPSKGAIKAAEAMILRLANSTVPVPIASVGAEGQSNLHWSDDDFYADVDVFDDKTQYFIVCKGERIAGEEELNEAIVPPRLFLALMDKYRGVMR